MNKQTCIKKVVLVGNPNVGKSSLFQQLSGSYVEISNYPGTTVDILKTNINESTELIDTPGVYSISCLNDEERITQESIKRISENDLVINVVNATTLEKDLFLTLHLIDLKIPFILVINQIDQIERKEIKIYYSKLSSMLGVPVFPISALKVEGLETLKKFIREEKKVQIGNISIELEGLLSEFLKKNDELQTQFDTLMWLEEDSQVIAKTQTKPQKGSRKQIYSKRRERVNRLIQSVIHTRKTDNSLTKVLNQFLIHPFFGTITGCFIGIFFLYQVLGVWVAGDLVNLLEKGFFERYWNPNVKYAVAHVFPSEIKNNDKTQLFDKGLLFQEKKKTLTISESTEFIFSPADLIDSSAKSTSLEQNILSSFGTILAGKYGLFTLAVTYLFGLLLPLIWFFYLSWSMLEDSGYLPRLAVLADGFLRHIGLNGRGVIPLVLGLGCVTMAVVTTRLMSNRREQLIMMILLGIAVPCSAQLGIIQSLLAKIGGFDGWLVWAGVILSVLTICGFLASKLLPGTPTPLLLELPPLRVPYWKNVLTKTNQKSWFFFQEAGLAFIWASLAISVLQVTGGLNLVINSLKPLVSGILHLPKEVALSFLLGMVRRDFGAFGLLNLELSKIQVVTACVTLTLFVPCIATLAVMIKERNWKTALGIWSFAWFIGFGVGGCLTRVLEAIEFN
ncbi:MAG: ferrous iron transporter B [Candidatus Caenarcaniphilales bacterium]|nr:ferrous iron transporter B [Candidatus Caenarcaniphilales bacterium]